MNDRRLTPLMGVVSVVLFVVSVFVVESGDIPGDDATGAELAAYLDESLGELAISAVLWGLGVIALIWFLDGLRTHIAPASAQLGRLAYGFGFAAALCLLLTATPDVAGALASDNLDRSLDGGAAEAMTALGDGFFIAAEVMLVGFFSAVGLASLRARALPAWFGGISLLLALIALVPPIGWAVVVFGLPLWLLVASALLWRGTRSAEPQPV